MIVRTEEERKVLREGGKRTASILTALREHVVPGVSAAELEELAKKMLREYGDRSAFLNYSPEPGARGYPNCIIVSVNDEIVHGLPEKEKIFKDGDVVSLDFALVHEGLITDSALTCIAGTGNEAAEHLVQSTGAALEAGIARAVAGNRVGEIGNAVSEVARKNGLTVFREFAGHGVGRHLHEDPMVPNYGKRDRGVVLSEGSMIAIEPIFTEGKDGSRLLADGLTYATRDGSRAAHFEHTVIVGEEGAEVLTRIV